MHKLFLVFSLFLYLSAVAQDDKQIRFIAYGHNPTIPNDTLFANLKKAITTDLKIKAIEDLIYYHDRVGNSDSIVTYGQKMYKLSLLNTDKTATIAQAAYYIAQGYTNKGFFDSALEWYLKGLEYADSNNDSHLYYQNRIGLAITKFMRGDTNEAITLINDIIDSAPDQKIKHDAIFNLGRFNFYLKNYETSLVNFKEALNYYQVEDYLKEELLALYNIAMHHHNNEDYEKAKQLYFDVYSQAADNQFFDIYIKSGNNIGKLFIDTEWYQQAQLVLASVQANAYEWSMLEDQRYVMRNLQLLYSKLNDYKNAYAISTQLIALERDILNNQNKTQTNELEVKYETLEKEQEITKQRTQKQYILIGFLAVLIPLLGLFYMYYQKLQTQSKLNKTQEEVNNQKVAALLKDQELQLIKASVSGEERERKRIAQELHDSIGGNLATIKLQLSSHGQEHIVKQIDDTYNQVRDLSHNLMPKKFKDTAFTTLLTQYINQVQTPNAPKIMLHVHPEKEVNTIKPNIKTELYKIIQELITNALKHAQASEINIHLTKIDNELKLLFEDNGVGFKTHKLKEGIGFTNIKERLKTINGKMHIDAYPNRGTIVDIDVYLA